MAKKLTEDQIKWILSLDASGAEREVNKLSKENSKLAERNKDVRRSLQQLEAQGKKNSENYRTLSEEYRKNSDQLQTNRLMMKRLDEQMGVANLTMTQLKRRAKDLQTQLNNTSKTLHPEEWNNLNKQLTETKERMGELKNSAGEIEKQMNKSAQLVGKWSAIYGKVLDWGSRLIDNAKEIAIEGVRMAESFDGVSRAFSRLDSDGTLLEKLRTATKGTVSDLELMKATVLGNDLQIPLQDIGKYLQFAQLKAQQTGQSVDYLAQSIITGLGRRSVEILDNLGLSSVQIREETEKTGDFMAVVAKIVDEQLAGATVNYVSASDKAQQATVRFQNAQLKLGETLLPLKENWDEVYTGMSVGTMELIGWVVKHRDVLVTLVTAVTSYRIATQLANIVQSSYNKQVKLSVTLNNLLGKAMKANPWGLVISLVTTAISYFTIFKDKTNALKDSLKQMNEEITVEQRSLTSLFDVLKRTTDGTKERRDVLQEINDKYGSYLPNLLTEKSSLNEIDAAYRRINEALVAQIAMKHKNEAIGNVAADAAKEQVEAIEGMREKLVKSLGSNELATMAINEVKQLTNLHYEAGQQWEKTFGTAFDVIKNKYLGTKSIAKGFSSDMEDFIRSVYNMNYQIDEIERKYANWTMPGKTARSNKKEEKPTVTTKPVATESITNPTVPASPTPDPAIAELQAKLDAEKALYEQQQLDLMELYASGRDENLQSETAYNEAMEQLTLMHLQRMMEISGMDAEQQRQVERELLEFKIKCRQELLDDTEKKKKEELAIEKENAQKTEQEVRQKFENMKGYSQQFGEALGNVISGQEDAMQALGNMMIDIVFQYLEKMVDAWVTELAAKAVKETASAQMTEIGSKGVLGLGTGAALAATIAGLLAAAKAGLKGIIGKRSSSSSSSTSSGQDASDIYRRVATGLESGGKIDIVRSQDGKLFPDTDYAPDRRGFVDRPTVIVGEGPRGHSREWVASNAAVSNPTVSPVLDIIDRSQRAGTIRTLDLTQAIRARLAGYASGGTIEGKQASRPSILPFSSGMDSKVMERLAIVLESIERDGIPASVALSELDRKQQLRDRSRKIGSKR